MKSIRLFAIIAASVALLSHAKAAVININEVIDLDAWTANGQSLLGTTHYSISDGDTVNVTYTFANGKALEVANNSGSSATYSPAWPWLNATNTSGEFNILNASVNLTGFSFSGAGSGSTSEFQASQNGAYVHLGLYTFFAIDDATSVTFTGITSSFTVDYLPEGTGDYVSWFGFWPQYTEAKVSVVGGNNVPDSGTTAGLLALGFAALAAVRRKR